MFLRFFFPGSFRLLAIRYGFLVAARLLWGFVFNDALRQIGRAQVPLFFVVLPNPAEVAPSVVTYLFNLPGVLAGSRVLDFMFPWWFDILMQAGQLLLLVGAGWLAISTLAPRLGVRVPWQSTAGELHGKRLRRPWWGGVLALAFATTYTMVLVTGLVAWPFTGAGTLGVAVMRAMPWPIWVSLGFVVLGFLWGHRWNGSARKTMAVRFGVQFVPPEHPFAVRVAALAARLDLPPPAVGLANVFNAYAAGSSIRDAVVVVGIPLARALSYDELDAVIGHELGHVISGDMRQMQYAEGYQRMFGDVFGIIATVGTVAAAGALKNSGARAVGQIGDSLRMVGRVLLAFVGELFTKGLSRNREFYADAVGAGLTTPETMAMALERVAGTAPPMTAQERNYGYLMFNGAKLNRLFATHPTMKQRTDALRARTYIRTLPRRPR